MHLICPICMDIFETAQSVATTRCGHVYHLDCIAPWIRRHHSCPDCRVESDMTSLVRVYFNGTTEENIHLSRNCKIEPMQKLLDSQLAELNQVRFQLDQKISENALNTEEILKLRVDLKNTIDVIIELTQRQDQMQNELTEMKNQLTEMTLLENKQTAEIHKYTINHESSVSKMIELHTIIESLQDTKSKYDYFKKQLNSIVMEFDKSNTSDNLDKMDELQTIIASLQDSNQNKSEEIAFLEQQLNATILNFEKIESDLRKANDEIIDLKLFGLTIDDLRSHNNARYSAIEIVDAAEPEQFVSRIESIQYLESTSNQT